MEEMKLRRAEDLLFSVQRSVRYHNRRQGWFANWHRAVTLLTLLATGTVAATLTHDFGVNPLWFTLVIGVLQGIELTVRLAERAALHQLLCGRLAGLERQLLPVRAFDDEEYQRLMGERLAIESGEPKDLMLLNLLCHYEQVIATNPDGDLSMLRKISRLRRWMAHLFSQTGYVAMLREKHLRGGVGTPAGVGVA